MKKNRFSLTLSVLLLLGTLLPVTSSAVEGTVVIHGFGETGIWHHIVNGVDQQEPIVGPHKRFLVDDAGGENLAYRSYSDDSDFEATNQKTNSQCSHCSLMIYSAYPENGNPLGPFKKVLDDGIGNSFSDPNAMHPY